MSVFIDLGGDCLRFDSITHIEFLWGGDGDVSDNEPGAFILLHQAGGHGAGFEIADSFTASGAKAFTRALVAAGTRAVDGTVLTVADITGWVGRAL